MKEFKEKVEVLAPVGSYESLMGAVQGGANSVYFGIEQLNMRARSSNNFTIEDLAEISRICKENDMKSYLTLNTILYDHDIHLMKHIINAAKKNNLDGIIAMDHAAINYASQIGMSVNISTQANITNAETVKFYAHFADVMVLSRELTLQQVDKISKQIAKDKITGPSGKLVSLETFFHGALCMAVSGKCYLSLHSMNSSANRGACKQNCRRTYTITDEDGNSFEVDNEYIMSPKDLCTVGFLDKILDAGVKILKIEGRSKGADYVKEVSSCYREAADMWEAKQKPDAEQIQDWEDRLSTVYNRGFWGGYYLGKKMGEWTDAQGSKATRQKVYLGKGGKYFSKIKVAEFSMENSKLAIGDKIMITGPSLGSFEMEIKELRLASGETTQEVKRGETFSMPVGVKIRPSDKLYRLEERPVEA